MGEKYGHDGENEIPRAGLLYYEEMDCADGRTCGCKQCQAFLCLSRTPEARINHKKEGVGERDEYFLFA